MQTKTCTKCGEEKPLDGFNKYKRTVDNRRSQCRECEAERDRRYREKNREKERERSRRNYEKNREKILERDRRNYEKNREKERERSRRYREKNREAMWERDRRNREENREIINAKISLHMATTREVSKSLSFVPPYTPWSEEEDAFLMADNGMTAYQKATHLGRTYDSCVHRRKKLKKLRKKLGVSPGDH